MLTRWHLRYFLDNNALIATDALIVTGIPGDYMTIEEVHKMVRAATNAPNDMIGFAGRLDPRMADMYLAKIKDAKIALDEHVPVESEDPFATRHEKEVLLPYLFATLESAKAQVILNKAGATFSTKERYLLNLQSEGLTIDDVAYAAAEYRIAAGLSLSMQRQIGDIGSLFTNTSGIEDYTRLCQKLIYDMDVQASKMFGIGIHTPANFDVKERSPHQHLGRINVGFEHIFPQLLRVIAHEGPFGHNTHEVLSSNSSMKGRYTHTREGIAILGEHMVQDLWYPDERYDILKIMLDSRRTGNDAFGAAYEKAAFHDQLSVEQIVDLLETPLMSATDIRSMCKGLENGRDDLFSFGATPYFAGSQMILKIYADAMNRLKCIGGDDEMRANVIQGIYTGQRPARIVKAGVDLHLDHIENFIAKNPKTSLTPLTPQTLSALTNAEDMGYSI